MLPRLDHVASIIVNANHNTVGAAVELRAGRNGNNGKRDREP